MPCRYFEKKMPCILNFWNFSVNTDHFYKFVNTLVYLPLVAEDYEMLFVRLSKELLERFFVSMYSAQKLYKIRTKNKNNRECQKRKS